MSEQIKSFQELNLLEMVIGLVEKLNNGQISAKDLDNEAGSIRLKIASMKAGLKEIEGLDQSLEERDEKIQQLLQKIKLQVGLIDKFQKILRENESGSEHANGNGKDEGKIEANENGKEKDEENGIDLMRD